MKIRKGIGLEMLITPIRKRDSASVGRWFEDIRELHLFCHSISCQLVLSSGATSVYEMVSGRCFDAILRNCGIKPDRYWSEMDEWIQQRFSRRVSVQC
jgi:RNase P/RNase MRP subunit p30